jgi:hypothetical protein
MEWWWIGGIVVWAFCTLAGFVLGYMAEAMMPAGGSISEVLKVTGFAALCGVPVGFSAVIGCRVLHLLFTGS